MSVYYNVQLLTLSGISPVPLFRLDSENIFPKQLSPEVLQAMKSVRFIAQHIKDADKDNEVSGTTFPVIYRSYLNGMHVPNTFLYSCLTNIWFELLW